MTKSEMLEEWADALDDYENFGREQMAEVYIRAMERNGKAEPWEQETFQGYLRHRAAVLRGEGGGG